MYSFYAEPTIPNKLQAVYLIYSTDSVLYRFCRLYNIYAAIFVFSQRDNNNGREKLRTFFYTFLK